MEATPAESTSYRLAKHDVEQFPDIITASEPGGTPYYTNSSHLPVGFTEDIFEALDIQDHLQTPSIPPVPYAMPFWVRNCLIGKAAAALVRKIAENYQLPYYTYPPRTPFAATMAISAGNSTLAPYVGKKAEVYSRITATTARFKTGTMETSGIQRAAENIISAPLG